EAEGVTIERLAELATHHGVPRSTVESAVAAAENYLDRERCQSFLHRLMESDSDVHTLRAQLSNERALELHHVQGFEDRKIIDLVALGAYARKPGDTAPLIPARYHIMARAISGVYAWFDSNSRPQLIARREKCHVHEKHEFTVFELA